jgi:hypothetical protein
MQNEARYERNLGNLSRKRWGTECRGRMLASFGTQLTTMATAKFETTFYEPLYTNLDQQLAEINEGRATIESSLRAISLVRETVAELRAGLTEPFPDRDAQIAFFREVWPRVYGRLFFFLLVNRFEGDRLGLPVGALPALIQRGVENSPVLPPESGILAILPQRVNPDLGAVYPGV